MTNSKKITPQIERREGTFISSGHRGYARRSGILAHESDAEIFYQSWNSPNARATLVVTHGISEHSDAYAKTAVALGARGWNIIAWDMRGHGRSEGKRGYVAHFSDYARDLGNLLLHLRENGQLSQPFALVGHSMGGLVTLDYLAHRDAGGVQPTAATFSSPLLGVSLAVPAVKDMAAHVLARVWPTITLYNEIRYEDLTRDPEFLKSYETDSLRHEKISPTLYLSMFETMDEIKKLGPQITLPVLMQAAGQERIVSLQAIKDFFPLIGSKNKKLIIYENSYHEIFNDLDRETVFNDLSEFLSPIFP